MSFIAMFCIVLFVLLYICICIHSVEVDKINNNKLTLTWSSGLDVALVEAAPLFVFYLFSFVFLNSLFFLLKIHFFLLISV